ncbi:MAG: hypothetical protein ACI4TB_02780 [Lachnospiraceae bacterium]
MKFVKGISLFLIYPCIMFGIGMYAGIVLDNYFYPGSGQSLQESGTVHEETEYSVVSVSAKDKEVLNADTEYVIEEYDTKRDTLVETTWKVPAKYLGMGREDFVTAMELYALSPPLSEQERGFVGVEVRSFSADRVVVRMNYAYAEPTESFYLRVEDNSIVVYCDDGKTVYMYTDISAQELPEYIQTQVILGMFMEDEAALYHFLETYSS